MLRHAGIAVEARVQRLQIHGACRGACQVQSEFVESLPQLGSHHFHQGRERSGVASRGHCPLDSQFGLLQRHGIDFRLCQPVLKYRILCATAVLPGGLLGLVMDFAQLLFHVDGEVVATAFELEQEFGDRPAVIFLAHEVRHRNPHVIKEYLALLNLAVQTDDGRDGDARALQINQ